MLSKFSVKKPMTVFVSVILVIILGVMSFTKMQTDLLPSMDLPYAAVITAYPGASPEKVELNVTKPLEKALATAGGIEEVTSISNENSSIIMLQFAQGTNMDSVMIELSSKIDLVKARLDSGVGMPQIMRINPDMLPVMIASVDIDGKDISETSRIVRDVVIPAFERIGGVASVNASGMTEKQLKITLSQQKIDALNQKTIRSIDEKLEETQSQLDEGAKAIDSAKAQLNNESSKQTGKLNQAENQLLQGIKQLEQGVDALTAALEQAQTEYDALVEQKNALEAEIEEIKANGGEPTREQLQTLAGLTAGEAAAREGIAQLTVQKSELSEQLSDLYEKQAQLALGKKQLQQGLAKAKNQLAEKEQELEAGREQFDAAREEAYKNAGLDGVITAKMINGILMGENFSMPAGYLTEGEEQYVVKVGNQFADVAEIEELELFHADIEGLEAVKLADVADIELGDNSGEMYAKINGNDGVLLTFQKQSTASTAEVSESIRNTMQTLSENNPGMHITALNDQGIYINIVVNSVLNNLLMGGLLAILILLLFMRSFKPTITVAFSIPISLLFALVLMYFSGITLNIISLAGLALGVGMLVDNSIVVIENIYRLRTQGVPAAQAAVRGASQVGGAIAASTLTTICVFLPIVFTQGISRQLFTDMGLTIAYSLIASLLIALTLVPAMSSNLLKKPETRQHKMFDKFTNAYSKLLAVSLKHKSIVFALSLALLVTSAFGAASMGTAFMPEADTSQLMVSLKADSDTSTEDLRAISDEATEKIQAVEGVETVGAMQGTGSMMAGGSDNTVSIYVILKENRSVTSTQVAEKISQATADMPCELSVQASAGDMSAMGGSGIQVKLHGQDLDKLKEIAADVKKLIEETEGTTAVSDGMEEAGKETRVVVDKNEALRYGLTVAQVYQEISAALQTESTATTITVDSEDVPVMVIDKKEKALTRETLKNHMFTVTVDGEEKEIPLSDIAKIIEEDSLLSIKHDNQVRVITVSAEVDGEHNIGLVSRDLETKLKDYQLPEGYTLSMGGENETINNTLRDLVYMVLLAVALIYLIMVAQFQSLLSPFIIMFTIPLAFTGGLLALWICGMEISVIAMLGFLVLAGVVVNNGIVFVDYTNQLRLEGMERREALITAGRTRIRPILMTALTTILGLFTLALGIGQGADMLQPMAVVTIGGLAYATLLTLFVVPALYDVFQRRPLKNRSSEAEPEA